MAFDDGSELAYGGLVVATGARARALPGTEGLDAVHTLRTLDDCLAIRARLEATGAGRARVVVIGAGFIGSEVAATCHGLGAEVTVVEALPTPLAPGARPGDGGGLRRAPPRPRRAPPDRGGRGRGRGTDGRTAPAAPTVVSWSTAVGLEADVVVVGIGVAPEVEWLEGSGARAR